jgi:ubiquinone biosynthesis protein
MLASLGAAARLAAAGWRLARADALLPRELRALYPPALHKLSRLAGLLAVESLAVGLGEVED